VPFPRATSEPPPELDEVNSVTSIRRFGTQARRQAPIASSEHPSSLKLVMPETEEYSWEWGNFPQKTPVWTAFNYDQMRSNDMKGKGRMSSGDATAADSYSSISTSSNESMNDRDTYINEFASPRLAYGLWRRWLTHSG
jgi:phosphatidate phosphatase LPIN